MASTVTKAADFSTMLQAARVPRSGQFYLLKAAIADADIKNAFANGRSDIAGSAPNGGQPPSWPKKAEDWQIVRTPIPAPITYTLLGVSYDVSVIASVMLYPFARVAAIAPSAVLQEFRVGFMLLAEMEISVGGIPVSPKYLFVQRELMADPVARDLSASCDEIGNAAFIEPFYNPSLPSRIERMSMRKIAATRGEVQRKILEAHDVSAATSSFGLHRTIGGAMHLAMPPGSSTRRLDVSAQSGRLRAGSSRVNLQSLLEWAAECAVRLQGKHSTTQLTATFLAEMAMPLPSMQNSIPDSLAFDHLALQDALEEMGPGVNWQPTAASPTVNTFDEFLDAICEPVTFDKKPRDSKGTPLNAAQLISATERYFHASPVKAGDVPTVVKLRVTARTCSVEMPQELGSLPFGPSNVLMPVDKAIVSLKAMRVVFDSAKSMYSSEGAFKTSNIQLSIQQLLSIVVAVPSLNGVHSEKGEIAAMTTKLFDPTSSFYAIESDPLLAKPSSLLVCDDGKTEWCDYLEVDTTEMRMRWMHAKVAQHETRASKIARQAAKAATAAGTPTAVPQKKTAAASIADATSASGFQEVVGQAIKNLARLRMSSGSAEVVTRIGEWRSDKCEFPVGNKLPKIRRSGGLAPSQIAGRIGEITSNPLAVFEVALVVPNYSKNALALEFNKIATQTAEPQVVQAFWILSGFMNSCLEVGARPQIFMRP